MEILGRLVRSPATAHRRATKHLLCNLYSARELIITIGAVTSESGMRNGKLLKQSRYGESDLGGDISTRRSTGVVSFKCKVNCSTGVLRQRRDVHQALRRSMCL